MPVILSVIGVAVLLGGGFAVFSKMSGGDAFHGLTHLNIQEFLENSKSLQGNVYMLEGKVDDQLAWSEEGRVLSVMSQGSPVGVKVPQEFSNQNIQHGQSFVFKVQVGEGGFLMVQALKKS